jgi:hypothetical protein
VPRTLKIPLPASTSVPIELLPSPQLIDGLRRTRTAKHVPTTIWLGLMALRCVFFGSDRELIKAAPYVCVAIHRSYALDFPVGSRAPR